MEADLPTQKQAARQAARHRLVETSALERAERSRRLVARLVALPAWNAAAKVLLFAPLPTEPDLDLLWKDGALSGKQVAYPRVEGATMQTWYVHAPEELKPARWGLREPLSLAERRAALNDFDLVLVPGLAFDAAGGRLGRGGGFYDRLLEGRNPAKTRLVGVCFAFQVVAEPLLMAAHDVRMDEICTD